VVIEADPDGYPRTQPQLALIDCRLPEGEIRRRFPAFWSYLEDGEGKKIHQGYLTSRRSPWYSKEDRPPAPFLCTYMGRSQNGRKPFRFLWNQSAATAHNVYLLLYPKGPVRAACAREPRLSGVVFEALQKLDTDEFMGEGRVYGGGLYKMEPKELAQISGEAVFEAIKEHLTGAGMERMLPFSPER
jgi:adenine-specific DNA-methyltransferase